MVIALNPFLIERTTQETVIKIIKTLMVMIANFIFALFSSSAVELLLSLLMLLSKISNLI